MPTAEQLARANIDALLSAAGWAVQDVSATSVPAGQGVAMQDPAGRELLPNTLIFAKDDPPQESVVETVREEFRKANGIVQRITYRTTGAKPIDLINEFRTSPMSRIAITVDMNASGSHIKAKEITMFMHAVKSSSRCSAIRGSDATHVVFRQMMQLPLAELQE